MTQMLDSYKIKEEPNRHLRTEKYNNKTKYSVDGSTSEWRRQRKSPVNLKIKQWKLPSLNNRERLD